MSDLVQRLRFAGSDDALGIGEAWRLLDDAADEIERLRAERDEAVALLKDCRPWVARGLGDHAAPMPEDYEVLARLDAFLAGMKS